MQSHYIKLNKQSVSLLQAEQILQKVMFFTSLDQLRWIVKVDMLYNILLGFFKQMQSHGMVVLAGIVFPHCLMTKPKATVAIFV